MYKVLNDKEEYLRVTLEQIGLHERDLSQLNGFSSKLKAIHMILNIVLSVNDFDFNDIETDDEKQKVEKLIELLNARISFGVKGMIKCLSSKASKNKDLIIKWKKIDENIDKTNALKNISVFERLNKICDLLVSSELVQKSD